MCWMCWRVSQQWQWCSLLLTAVWRAVWCHVDRRAHLSPVSCSLASTVQTFPATSSICSAMLDMFVVCSQSRSYTFSVCKMVCVCVCVVRARVCACACACVCVCAPVEARGGLCVSLTPSHTPCLFPQTRSLADPAARLAARRSQQCCLYFTPRSRAWLLMWVLGSELESSWLQG